MPYHRDACLTAGLLATLSMAATASEITVSGTPQTTAIAGEPYQFVPTVTDANMSDLQFAYVNRPSWSGSYRGSGAIIGTPSEPGIYADIQIEAWDGVNFGVSAPFTITVVAAGSSNTGSVALSWTKPSENTDGSALTNLGGYLIRYGTSIANLDRQLMIRSADSTGAEIGELAPGNWYFKIASITDAEVRGPFSAIVPSLIP